MDVVFYWLIQSKLRDLLATSTSKTVLVVTDEGIPAGKLIFGLWFF
jgi:biopolymer transport protein ExbD